MDVGNDVPEVGERSISRTKSSLQGEDDAGQVTTRPTRPFTRSQGKILQDIHLHLTWEGMEETHGSALKTFSWSTLDERSTRTRFEMIAAQKKQVGHCANPEKPLCGRTLLC